MTAHLLILYPAPKNAEAFDRAYREEHLPYAGPRLMGALDVTTKRVVGPAGKVLPYYLMSDVSFPTIDAMKAALHRPVVRRHSRMQPPSAPADRRRFSQ